MLCGSGITLSCIIKTYTRAFFLLHSIPTQKIMRLLIKFWGDLPGQKESFSTARTAAVWVLCNLVLCCSIVYEIVLHALLYIHKKNHVSTPKTPGVLDQKSLLTPHLLLSCGSCVTLCCVIEMYAKAFSLLYSTPIQKICAYS